ncbi:MAG: hypothetical protein GEU91_19380 [Rhizobiales bacterium]|nr:hypothetical protein [Hyphomicrobiales bacterium]
MTRSLFVGVAALLAAAVSAGWAGTAEAQSYGFATFSAVVKANGVTARSSGVQKSTHSGTGLYLIDFLREVNTCSIVGGPRGVQGGQVSVTDVSGNPKQIKVRTFSRAGQAADLSFVVLVNCAS